MTSQASPVDVPPAPAACLAAASYTTRRLRAAAVRRGRGADGLSAAYGLAYQQPLQVDPARAEGLRAFDGGRDSGPSSSEARQDLAQLYLAMGRVTDAVHLCAMGLVTVPRDRGIRGLLGLAYGALGRREVALELYRKWLKEEPDNPVARHHHAACVGGNGVPAQASQAYVRSTFDSFASSFDAKLADLDCRVPQLVGQAVADVLGEPDATLRMADAGCGTGLCAPYLAPYAASLVGVDLSAQMLDRAAARGGYSELVNGELTAFLDSRPGAFDVLVAADTLCYFGHLGPFAAAAHRCLGGERLLVFTVESHDALPGMPGWQLQTHGRYSHRKDYVQAVLVGAGFADPVIESVVLRLEACKPVHGWLVCCAAA